MGAVFQTSLKAPRSTDELRGPDCVSQQYKLCGSMACVLERVSACMRQEYPSNNRVMRWLQQKGPSRWCSLGNENAGGRRPWCKLPGSAKSRDVFCNLSHTRTCG